MLGKKIKDIDFNFKPTIFHNITYWFKRKRFQLKKLKSK